MDADNRIVECSDEPGLVPPGSELEPSGLPVHAFHSRGWDAFHEAH